jgi:hypothetical protein
MKKHLLLTMLMVLALSAFAQAAVADFDGDGATDISVFRPETGQWFYILSATNTFGVEQFGQAGDVVLPADYDGDGRTDLSVYRPSTSEWFIRTPASYRVFKALAGDVPVPADYDGDGKADVAIYRESNNQWYILSANNNYRVLKFGKSGDIPLSNPNLTFR